MSADDWYRVESQPFFRQGGVEATEIVVGRQVSLSEISRFQRRIGPVHSTIYPVADGERYPSRTVVGTSAIIADAASKLAEQHNNHLV